MGTKVGGSKGLLLVDRAVVGGVENDWPEDGKGSLEYPERSFRGICGDPYSGEAKSAFYQSSLSSLIFFFRRIPTGNIA